MAIFPGAGTRSSPFWILLVLRMLEEVVTTGAISCAKLFYRQDAVPVAQPTVPKH